MYFIFLLVFLWRIGSHDDLCYLNNDLDILLQLIAIC